MDFEEKVELAISRAKDIGEIVRQHKEKGVTSTELAMIMVGLYILNESTPMQAVEEFTKYVALVAKSPTEWGIEEQAKQVYDDKGDLTMPYIQPGTSLQA